MNLGVELLMRLIAMLLRNCQIEELEKIIQLGCKLGELNAIVEQVIKLNNEIG